MLKSYALIGAVVFAASLTTHGGATPKPSAPEYTAACPEKQPDEQARLAEMMGYMRWYFATHTGASYNDYLTARLALLEQHHCTETLANIKRNSEP